MTVTLVTIEGVPIVSTGTYQLASGETTFSAEDLADAVQAAQDPTGIAPRIKIGHTDPRYNDAVASGELDGEPAFGTVANLHLSDDGQTIIGDYVDVPDWLGDSLQSSFPGRSIEGGFGVELASGRKYKLVIAAVSLLGVVWPGVTSLPDLREILEHNGSAAPEEIEAIEAGADRFVVARVRRPAETPPAHGATVEAGMDLGNVRMMFCADLDDGDVPTVEDADLGSQIWWWPRSIRVEDDGSLCLIVDDDEGHLVQIPFTVSGTDLEYGSPRVVMETYTPVAASSAGMGSQRPRVLAQWPIRAARPSTTPEVTTMDVDPAVIRRRLGLADDADEAAITEALNAEPAVETTEVAASTETETTTAPATTQIPEGMALVDQATLDQIRSQAEQGAAVAASLATQRRDQVIQAAIDDGKFPPSRREHYQTAWDRDREGTETLLTASVADGGLAPGLVPTGGRELGRQGEGDNDPATSDAQHDAFMAQRFPQASARLREGRESRVRVRQEA